jgi:hypothetical protein
MLLNSIAVADGVLLRSSGPSCNFSVCAEQGLLAFISGEQFVEMRQFRVGPFESQPSFGDPLKPLYRIELAGAAPTALHYTTNIGGEVGAGTSASSRSRLRSVSIAPKRVAKTTIALVFDARIEIWQLRSRGGTDMELLFSHNFLNEVLVCFEWSNTATKQAYVSSNKCIYNISFPTRKEANFSVAKEEAVALDRGLIASSRSSLYSVFGCKHALGIHRPDRRRPPGVIATPLYFMLKVLLSVCSFLFQL